MNIFHVEVISSHGIGDGVLRESLRLFHRVTEDCVKSVVESVDALYSRCHQLRVEFNRVVSELRSRYCL